MKCRSGCAACCHVISISSPIPGLPGGKPAGVVCIYLDSEDLTCKIWETTDYPAVCRNFKADPEYCGRSREEAQYLLAELERTTAPE